MRLELSRRSLITGTISGLLLPQVSSAQAAVILKNGTDVTWVTNYEAAGGVFYTSAGKLIDPFVLLKNAKATVVRIRVFVNPSYRNGRLEDAIKLAKRAKAVGLEVCIDFHFSDDWADPGHQWTPAGWSTTSITLLASQLRNYVLSSLNEFKRNGLDLEYVQLGNEITNGMLWPLGKIESASDAQWNNLAQLYDVASGALREVMPNAKNILHLDCGGDANRTRWWIAQSYKYWMADYDMVGLSYYPQWHGSLANLTDALKVVAKEYNLPVLVAETAYPYTSQTFGGDVINPQNSFINGYPLTPAGQAAFLRKLKTIVRALPNKNGFGVWWWEGLAGRVATKTQVIQDFGMTNSTLIDTRSRALSSLNALNN